MKVKRDYKKTFELHGNAPLRDLKGESLEPRRDKTSFAVKKGRRTEKNHGF